MSFYKRNYTYYILLLLLSTFVCSSCANAATSASSSATPTTPASTASAPSCKQNDTKVADPTAPHGLFVFDLNVPGSPKFPVNYFLHDPTVCGLDLIVPWSQADRGPNANPQYNWSYIDQAAQPWIQAGKEVNFIVRGVSESPRQEFNGQPYTPAYVLQQVHTIQPSQCPGEPIVPVYWESGYINNYENFMRALLQHYANAPWLTYVRFGIGKGGEDFPEKGFQAPNSACAKAWQQAGYSVQRWTAYSVQVVKFEKSLNPAKTLSEGLNGIGKNVVPDAVAKEAVQDGFGIGMQGFSVAEGKLYTTNPNACGADWCNLFRQNSGKVPLDLQPFSADGTANIPLGELPAFLPLAIQAHAQILELYPQSWLIADDPSFPGYTTYHTSYQQALKQTADVVGISG